MDAIFDRSSLILSFGWGQIFFFCRVQIFWVNFKMHFSARSSNSHVNINLPQHLLWLRPDKLLPSVFFFYCRSVFTWLPNLRTLFREKRRLIFSFTQIHYLLLNSSLSPHTAYSHLDLHFEFFLTSFEINLKNKIVPEWNCYSHLDLHFEFFLTTFEINLKNKIVPEWNC